MTDAHLLITENIDVWTTAIKKRSATGRGSNKKIELTGIKKLRELILELAVRGKLVPQDSNDEPASVLLEKIAAEKAQLIKDKKIKKPKELDAINDNEKNYELPIGWTWIKLGLVTNFINGYAFKSSDFEDNGVGIVKIGDIQNGVISTDSMSRVSSNVVEPLDVNLKVTRGDLLIAMSGVTTGKLGFNCSDEMFYLNQRVGKIVLFQLLPEYIYFPLTTKIAENLAKSMGSAIPNISTTQINNIVFALPPLAEQHRIAAKVDELMALCDQLEQQTEDSITAHQTLVGTLLVTLSNSENPATFNQNWARIAEHFDTLFTTEHSIDQLKQTILQLAVMGKLVPQNPNDEPASVLLEKIATEKEQLIKNKKIKKQKPLPAITEDEKPFELPNGWEWRRFYNIFHDLKYGTSKKSDYLVKGSPVLRIPNIVKGYIDSNDLKFSELTNKELNELKLKTGDLLLIRSNGSLSIVGQSAVVDDAHEGFAYAGYLVRVRLNIENYNSNFLSLVLRSMLIRDQIEGPIRTTSGVKNINSTEISKLIMPIVSLVEQQRIVKKVDELMLLCNQLKNNINQAQTTQLQLAATIVEQAVS